MVILWTLNFFKRLVHFNKRGKNEKPWWCQNSKERNWIRTTVEEMAKGQVTSRHINRFTELISWNKKCCPEIKNLFRAVQIWSLSESCKTETTSAKIQLNRARSLLQAVWQNKAELFGLKAEWCVHSRWNTAHHPAQHARIQHEDNRKLPSRANWTKSNTGESQRRTAVSQQEICN